MDTMLLDRAQRFAPPWLRYMLTLSEASKTGESWVVATGDDIGLWDTDSGAVLPLWPDKSLAADSIGDGQGEPAAVSTSELAERILPFLVDQDGSLTLFPNFCEDMLVEPAAVSEDLTDFVADPVDIAAELVAKPASAEYEEWALLESPEVDDEQPEGWAPSAIEAPAMNGDAYAATLAAAKQSGALWLVEDPAEDAVVGIVLDDRPALALFATEQQAKSYADDIGDEADLVAKPVGLEAIVSGWLLVAYGAHWSVAVGVGPESATFVEPTRLALDLVETVETD
jgi:hypothetical protein